MSFTFQVRLANDPEKASLSCQEVFGISLESADPLIMGTENRFQYRIPSTPSFSNLQLKRGILPKSSAMFNWIQKTLEQSLSSPISPKQLEVTLVDSGEKAIAAWTFSNAYPVKWSISNFNKMEGELVFENLEFTYSHFSKTL